MPIFELHIAGEIVRDENINSLYKAIEFTEAPWKIYSYRQSKMNKIPITNKWNLTPREIDAVIKDHKNGYSQNSISKRRSISVYAVENILKNNVI